MGVGWVIRSFIRSFIRDVYAGLPTCLQPLLCLFDLSVDLCVCLLYVLCYLSVAVGCLDQLRASRAIVQKAAARGGHCFPQSVECGVRWCECPSWGQPAGCMCVGGGPLDDV